MIVQLDFSSNIPIYVQIRNQIVLGIGNKELIVGEKLPTVRQLAEDIGVNNMTVSKAYIQLKHEGYIETDRRNGVKIKRNNSKDFNVILEEKLALLIAEAKVHGVERESFINFCEKLYF